MCAELYSLSSTTFLGRLVVRQLQNQTDTRGFRVVYAKKTGAAVLVFLFPLLIDKILAKALLTLLATPLFASWRKLFSTEQRIYIQKREVRNQALEKFA